MTLPTGVRQHLINKSFPTIIAIPPREKGDLQTTGNLRPEKGEYVVLTFWNRGGNILPEHEM